MTLRFKRREEERQVADLMSSIYDREAQIRQVCVRDATYRGDLIHRALVETMTAALQVGISIGLGRIRYRSVDLEQSISRSA
jgi:hypothetical protein